MGGESEEANLRPYQSMILHIDMDAFYASIEIRDQPGLAKLPVVVGSPHGRGVVLTANYIARRFGIHSAMPAVEAYRLCPQAMFVKPRMGVYAAVAKQIREIFFSFTELVEPLSLDEAFLDVTPSCALFGQPLTIAGLIKDRIRREVGLTASAGVAPNKFLAKLASDLEKPDGLVFVSGNVSEFLAPLPVSRVWGIGPRTVERLRSLGIERIGQLQQLSADGIQAILGGSGEHFHRLSHGIDDRPVVPDREAKSISHETTFRNDISDQEVLRVWLLNLCDDVARRLRRSDLVARKVHLKYRFPDFQTVTRSCTLAEATDSSDALAAAVDRLFNANCRSFSRGLRLVGVGVSDVKPRAARQLSLFDQEEVEKRCRVDLAADELCARFGKMAVVRGSRLHQS
jgi:DNA polymerase IV